MNKQQILRAKYVVPSVIAVLLIGTAAMLALFAGPLPTWIIQQLSVIIPSSTADAQLLLVTLLTAVGLFYFRQGSGITDHVEGFVSADSPPELPRNAPRLVGESFDSELDAALREVQLKDVDYSTTEPHTRLSETAHSSVKLAFECSSAEADRILQDGSWTTDPVAQAFLSSRIEFPLTHQLLQWANPGQAYTTAVDRTSIALEELRHDSRTGADQSPAERAERSATGWLTRLRSALSGRPGSDTAADKPSQETEATNLEGTTTTDADQMVEADRDV